MDLAYDNIAKEALPEDKPTVTEASASKSPERKPTLNEEVQDVYRQISTSSWGSWFGGQVSNVVKQGQSVLQEAQQEVASLGADATRQIATLRSRAFSLNTNPVPREASTSEADKDAETTPTTSKAQGSISDSTFLSKVQAEASKRWKDVQRAEDAADEKLMELGGYIFNIVKQSIEIQPGTSDGNVRDARFESKDESGKRVIHTSRFDAQLHVIHTTEKGFTEDPPASTDYKTFAGEFNLDKKTETISADLAKYPELRATMEKVVPDTVSYADFWQRYYFLRRSVEAAEERRKELLKAASAEEEVGWDDEDSDSDSDSEEDDSDDDDSEDDSDNDNAVAKNTPKPSATTAPKATAAAAAKVARPTSSASSATIQPTKTPAGTSASAIAKSGEPRKSNDEKSQADSDTSYDVVGAQSGKTSQAPNSPKDSRKADDDSDDEWE